MMPKKYEKDGAQYVSTAWQFIPLCETCRKHKNDKLYENAVSEKLIIHSCDAVNDSLPAQGETHCLLMVKFAAKYT